MKEDKEDKKKKWMEMPEIYADTQPESSFQLINKYGTYEIQPTADTDNQYPAIAQGFNEEQIKHDCRNPVENG
ncbi:MAG: hypothetical protein II802_00590 [Clostridia bacterium]|nr:hypothetical protein [Clostridia bacterium]